MKLNILVCVGSIAIAAVAVAMSNSRPSAHLAKVGSGDASKGIYEAQAEPTCNPNPTSTPD